MVILIKAPKILVLNRLIEKYFEKKTGQKVKLKEFLSVEHFSLGTGIDSKKVFFLISKSKTMHGYILNGEDLRIHSSAIAFISKRMREELATELSGNLSKFGYTKRIPATYR